MKQISVGDKTPSSEVLDEIVDAFTLRGRGLLRDEVRALEWIAREQRKTDLEARRPAGGSSDQRLNVRVRLQSRLHGRLGRGGPTAGRPVRSLVSVWRQWHPTGLAGGSHKDAAAVTRTRFDTVPLCDSADQL